MVKSRSPEYSKSILNYILKPLENSRWSIKAYRLFLRFLKEKYNVDVDKYLNVLKIPKTNVDLKIPSDNIILNNFRKLSGIYRDVFLLLVSSGLRLKEVIFFMKNRDKLEYNSFGNIIVYKIQLERGFKKAFYLFSLKEIIRNVKWDQVWRVSYKGYTKYCERRNIVRAKYVRKWVATKMFQLNIPEAVINFIQGRTPRSVLQQHYLNLYSIALREYQKYSNFLESFLKL